MNIIRGIAIVALASVSTAAMQAKVTLPAVFSDNMVVQQNSVLTVTGTARPLSTVTFRSDWTGGEGKTRTGKNGRFELNIPTPPAGVPIRSFLMTARAMGRRPCCKMCCRAKCGFVRVSRTWNSP